MGTSEEFYKEWARNHIILHNDLWSDAIKLANFLAAIYEFKFSVKLSGSGWKICPSEDK